jgi:hypothetical protein
LTNDDLGTGITVFGGGNSSYNVFLDNSLVTSMTAPLNRTRNVLFEKQNLAPSVEHTLMIQPLAQKEKGFWQQSALDSATVFHAVNTRYAVVVCDVI